MRRTRTTTIPARDLCRSVALITALLLCGGLLTGCGAGDELAEKAAEKAAEAGSSGDADVDLDAEDGSMKIEGEDGSSMQFGEDVELPEQFPGNVPLPSADYAVNSAIATGDRIQAGLVADADDVDELADELEQGLSGADYEIGQQQNVETGDSQSRSFQGVDAEWSVLVTVNNGAAEGLNVTYIITPADGSGG